jgi:predicted Zn-dependent peptidase
MFFVAEDVPLRSPLTPAPSYVPTITSTTLNNGASLVARHSPADNVTLKFALSCGSRHELFPEKGAAHLLAHAAFVGTQKESGLRLMRSLENHGCTVGASANREQIVYSVSAPAEFVDFAIEKVTEAVYSPPKYSHLIEERKVAAALDYETLKSCPQTALTELLHEAAYGDGTPMGSSLFASDLKKLDVGDVMEYRLRNFKTNNLAVFANGLALDSLQSSVKGFLSSSEAVPVTNIPSGYVGGSARMRADLGGDTHVAIAFPSQSGAAGKAYTVLKEVLDSRLKISSGGNHASAFSIPYSDGGLVGVYCAASSATGAEELIANVIKELKAIASSCDVTSAANKVTLANMLALEGGCSAADLMLAARVQGLDTMEYADVRNVTAQDVSHAAAAVLKSNPSVAILGTTYGLQSFESIKASMQ